ncbi:hypothetical protein JTE90_011826 [Oedothorax gibbosus]|uniref:Uncharacterized protein n=1 Tax=Oedothorax gibbosus TaxID=931172 RepID=A0AAV6VUC4_9ARAC|nr:hypothetical protein JTE90_011826 [Oedothorax gibbosus]
MELYLFSFIAVMVLTTIILKSIFCWMHCANQKSAVGVKNFLEKQRKELSASKSKLMHMEIPMGDIERTSTPVPMEEKRHRTQSEV